MKREALIVGINRYSVMRQHLTAPANDAEAIAQRLEQATGDYAWSVRRLPETFIEGKPSISQDTTIKQEKLKVEISNFLNPQTSSPPEVVLLFFSGCGLRQDQGEDSEAFLAASDTKAFTDDEKRQGISLKWLRQQLINSPIQNQVVLLDCSYSGELLNLNHQELRQWNIEGNRCLITACRDDRQAYSNNKHGVLTNLLLQALDPKLYPSNQWISTWTITELIEQQWETDHFLKLQIPLCRHFGERIRFWRGEKPLFSRSKTIKTIQREALVVGINRYPYLRNAQGVAQHLTDPANDAEAIAERLEQLTGNYLWSVRRLPNTFSESKLTVDPKRCVTQLDIEKEIVDLFDPKTKHLPEVVLFFFSGHILLKKQGERSDIFLCASDTKYNQNDEMPQAISLKWLHQKLISSPIQKQIVWLECPYTKKFSKLITEELEQWYLTLKRDCCLVIGSNLTPLLLQAIEPKSYQSNQWITSWTINDFIEQNKKEEQDFCYINFGQPIPFCQGSIKSYNLKWREGLF